MRQCRLLLSSHAEMPVHKLRKRRQSCSDTGGLLVKSRGALPFPVCNIVAPMVGQSDLAFRLLCRRHGAQLVYTQMLDAARLVEEPEYRQQMFLSEVHVQDRPLVVQLSGNDPRLVAAAALLVENSGQADAIDFNLGCPQQAAANGMYAGSTPSPATLPPSAARVSVGSRSGSRTASSTAAATTTARAVA